jgi:hypothetical protein
LIQIKATDTARLEWLADVRFGSFSTGSTGIACQLMSALPQKQLICAINSCAMSRLGSLFVRRGGFPGCVEQTRLRHACAVRI